MNEIIQETSAVVTGEWDSALLEQYPWWKHIAVYGRDEQVPKEPGLVTVTYKGKNLGHIGFSPPINKWLQVQEALAAITTPEAMVLYAAEDKFGNLLQGARLSGRLDSSKADEIMSAIQSQRDKKPIPYYVFNIMDGAGPMIGLKRQKDESNIHFSMAKTQDPVAAWEELCQLSRSMPNKIQESSGEIYTLLLPLLIPIQGVPGIQGALEKLRLAYLGEFEINKYASMPQLIDLA